MSDASHIEKETIPACIELPELPIEARRHPVIAIVRCAIVEECALTPPEGVKTPIVLGVSGGADSCALLVAMLALRGTSSFNGLLPIVAHVNHGLRGDAVVDASFAASLAARYRLPFEQVDLDLRSHADDGDEPGNLYQRARDARYDALARIGREYGASMVAVAHHADDQLETMLMHLCRGTGPVGMVGMPGRRALEGGVSLIRPLLRLRRVDCESLCVAGGVSWRDDPSNQDVEKTRARLRAAVSPVLESLWPGASARASRCATDARACLRYAIDHAKAEARVIERTHRMTRFDRASLATLPHALIAVVLRDEGRALGSDHSVPDAVSGRAVLEAMTRAITGKDGSPREFAFDRNLRCVVASKYVELSYIEEVRHED